MIVKDEFSIDEFFIPVLSLGINDELMHLSAIIEYYSNPESDEVKFSNPFRVATYIENYTNRYNSLKSALGKILNS